MALPISIPYTFANATTSIPLSQLDSDFSIVYAAVNGIGNGTVALPNVSISGGNGTFTTITSPVSTNLTIQSSSVTAMTIDTNQNVTAVGTLAMASSFKRNRIINGNMLIDQRNAGAQITAANLTSGSYMIDRWRYLSSQAAKFTAQQNAGAVTTALGFPNYLGMTVSTAVTVGASDYFSISQPVEGFNFADLAWGTASAKTVTLSFVVYSSLTGTFGGVLKNSAGTRSYPFTYSIASANTWTTISVTVAGDTSGTWVGATNGIGVIVEFGLGVGSTYSTTAGSWAGGNYTSATGAVSVVGTSGATFYITGVQLEVGTKATPYEMQIYSDQFSQCQRYYAYMANANTAFCGATSNGSTFYVNYYVPVTMRAPPTVTGVDGGGGSGFPSTTGSLTPRGTNVITEGRAANATIAAGYFGSNITATAEL